MKLPISGIELLKLDNATIDQLLDMAIAPPSSELWMRGKIEENCKDSRDLLRLMHMYFVRKLHELCIISYEKASLKKENVPVDQFDPTKPVSLGFFWELANSYIALGKYADAQDKINSCLEILDVKANQNIDFNREYKFNFFYKNELPFTRLLLNLTLVKIHSLQGDHNAAKKLCEAIENDHDSKRELGMLNRNGQRNVLYLMILEYSKLGLIEQAASRYREFIATIQIPHDMESESEVGWQQLNLRIEMSKLYPNFTLEQKNWRDMATSIFSLLIKNISAPMFITADGTEYITPNQLLYYAIRAAQPPCNIEAAKSFVENFPYSYIDALGDTEAEKARGLENLANFYASLDMIERAIEYYHMSYNLYHEYYDNFDRSPPLVNIACLYLKLGKFPEAIAYLILTGESDVLNSILLKYMQTQGLKPVSEIISDLLSAMDHVQLPDNGKLEESNICTLAKQFIEISNIEAARVCYEQATQSKYNPKGLSYFSLGMLDIEDGFIEQGISNLNKASDLGYISATYALIEQYVTPPPIQEEEQQVYARTIMAVDLVKKLFALKGKNYNFYYDPFYRVIQNLQNISMDGKLIFAMFLTHDNCIERRGPDIRDIDGDEEPDGLEIFKAVIKEPGGKLYSDVIVEHLKTLDLKYGIEQLSAANIFVLAGRKDEAKRIYMQIIDHEEGSALYTTANFMIGLILEAAGNISQAKEYYAQSRKSYNSHTSRIIFEHVELSEYSSCREGLLFLGELYEVIGDEDCIQKACDFYKRSAMATIQQQDSKTSTPRALLHSLASSVVNRVTGYQDEAIEALRRLSNQRNPLAMFALGEIYEAQGDMTNANKLYLDAAENENVPAMLKVAQLTTYDKVAMEWYWRAIAAGETDVAASAIRNKFLNTLSKNDIEKLGGYSCLYDFLGADFMIDPVVIEYNFAGDNPDATHSGISYERGVLKTEVQRQALINSDINPFVDPKTQTITSIPASRMRLLCDSNTVIIPNHALSGLIRYKLEKPDAPIATYPGFIDPVTGMRFIEPWLTSDGTSVEKGHPYAKVPNKNLKNIMLQFPVTGVDFLFRGVKQKNLGKNQEALQYFLQALELARSKQDLRTEAIYPENAKLCNTLFGHIAKCLSMQIKHRKDAVQEIMAEIRSRLHNVLAEKYDILMPILTSNITADIMLDPVIVANGQLYDSCTINAWFAAGNATDPNTKERIPMNFVRSQGLAGIIPFLLLDPRRDINAYPGFFNATGERFRDPHINTLGTTVEKGEPGAMYPNFWLNRIMEELNIPDRQPVFIDKPKLKI